MFKEVLHHFKISMLLLIVLTLLTGVIYPLLVTGIAQLFFPWKSDGSLISKNGHLIGSLLIGQSFTDSKYFFGRPSATKHFPYNSEASAGSNLSPTNPLFLEIVKKRVATLKEYNPTELIPVDLVTASASGLDPEISPTAALYQIPRIAKLRNIPQVKLQALVQSFIRPRTFGILGEPRVNVLELNLALDKFQSELRRDNFS